MAGARAQWRTQVALGAELRKRSDVSARRSVTSSWKRWKKSSRELIILTSAPANSWRHAVHSLTRESRSVFRRTVILKTTKRLWLRVELCVVLYGKPIAELRSITCHIGSHNVNCHPTQVNMRPALTSARKVGTRFTFPEAMKGWVDLGGWLYTEMV